MSNVAPTELCQKAQELLEASPISCLRELRVERSGASIVLSGRVDSFYQKQQAQELLRAISRDCELVNSVHVHHDS